MIEQKARPRRQRALPGIPETFRAARFTRIGSPDQVLQVDTVQTEPLQPGEVRIKVDACGLNRADWLYSRGEHYSLPKHMPSRIGSECAGLIVEVGEGVDVSLLGSPACTVPFDTAEYGVLGQYATVPARYLAPWPTQLDAAQAASTWMQYLTAYFGLVEVAAIGSDDFALIPAASSSAGLAAVQIAKMRGARVIATSRSAAKLGAIRAAGADHVLALDETSNLARSIMALTEGRGVRVVYDPVGGPFLGSYIDALAKDARILIYGLLSGQVTELPLVPLVRRAAVLHPYSMFNHVGDAEQLQRGIAFISDAVGEGLRPAVDSTFDLERVVDAYRRMDSHEQIGKIVVTVS